MSESASALPVPVSSRDHSRGPTGAQLTLVEYGDLECPHCALVHPVIQELGAELKDSLQVVFRHFPLPGHPHAQRAAEAAEAAAAQGQFWPMVDMLYENSGKWDTDFSRFARKLRLDMKQFNRELDSGRYRDRVRADLLGGIRCGIKGTPTIFINHQRYHGRLDFDALVAALFQASRTG